MRQRRETVEHPFGTIKARLGATHFLMKRLKNVCTEMALSVLAYNLTRVMNIIGIRPADPSNGGVDSFSRLSLAADQLTTPSEAPFAAQKPILSRKRANAQIPGSISQHDRPQPDPNAFLHNQDP